MSVVVTSTHLWIMALTAFTVLVAAPVGVFFIKLRTYKSRKS